MKNTRKTPPKKTSKKVPKKTSKIRRGQPKPVNPATVDYGNHDLMWAPNDTRWVLQSFLAWQRTTGISEDFIRWKLVWNPVGSKIEFDTNIPSDKARRMAGAVVRSYISGPLWAVVKNGEGNDVQRHLDGPKTEDPQPSMHSDEFVRWMDTDECARHRIPNVCPPRQLQIAWEAFVAGHDKGKELGFTLGYDAGADAALDYDSDKYPV